MSALTTKDLRDLKTLADTLGELFLTAVQLPPGDFTIALTMSKTFGGNRQVSIEITELPRTLVRKRYDGPKHIDGLSLRTLPFMAPGQPRT